MNDGVQALDDGRQEPRNAPIIETLIEPAPAWRLIDLAELWAYREMLWMLAVRDIKVRYKQTVFGAAWAILQPLATMVIFATLFYLLRARPVSASIPYAVTAYAGLVLWQFFANSVNRMGSSLVSHQAMIKKVYCPRLVFPLSTLVAGLLDFAVASLLLIGLMAWWGIVPGWSLLAVPLVVCLAMLTTLAIGLWLAALSAMYRDFIHVVGFMLQAWMYLSPVLYETNSVIPERWQALYYLNPMAGIIEGFRWSLFGETPAFPPGVLFSLVAVCVLLLGGLAYFRHVEQTLADWV